MLTRESLLNLRELVRIVEENADFKETALGIMDVSDGAWAETVRNLDETIDATEDTP